MDKTKSLWSTLFHFKLVTKVQISTRKNFQNTSFSFFSFQNAKTFFLKISKLKN